TSPRESNRNEARGLYGPRRDPEAAPCPAGDGPAEPSESSEEPARRTERLRRPAREVEAVDVARDPVAVERDLRPDAIDRGRAAGEGVAGGQRDGAGSRRDVPDVVGDAELASTRQEPDPHAADVRAAEPEDGILERRVLRIARGHRGAVAAGERVVEVRES